MNRMRELIKSHPYLLIFSIIVLVGVPYRAAPIFERNARLLTG